MAAELAARRPRFVVLAPWAWGEREPVIAELASLLPPGYARVAEVATPQWGGLWPAVIYEDQRGPGREAPGR